MSLVQQAEQLTYHAYVIIKKCLGCPSNSYIVHNFSLQQHAAPLHWNLMKSYLAGGLDMVGSYPAHPHVSPDLIPSDYYP
jgi:hypothetical protein